MTRTDKRKKAPIPKRLKPHAALLSMLIIAVIYYLVFHYEPIYSILIALKDFKFSAGILGSPWVGLEHFERLFKLRSFWEVFRNTLIISLYKLVFTFPAPIIFAILINEVQNKFFKKTIQTISYLPHFLSWVVLGGIFMQMLSPSIGPINIILKSLSLDPIFFLGDIKWFRTVLVFTSVWKGFGWGSVIYLATLSGVDPELYEAAQIDGANRFHRMRYITFPSLLPIMSINLIFAIGGLVNDDFDQIFNLYNPSVYQVGDVLSTYVYRVGLEQLEYGLSTAAGLFKNVISLFLIILANFGAKKMGDYGVW